MSELKQRYKVTVRCHKCGERFILRGKINKEGKYDTGFRQCICGNNENLQVDAHPE